MRGMKKNEYKKRGREGKGRFENIWIYGETVKWKGYKRKRSNGKGEGKRTREREEGKV